MQKNQGHLSDINLISIKKRILRSPAIIPYFVKNIPIWYIGIPVIVTYINPKKIIYGIPKKKARIIQEGVTIYPKMSSRFVHRGCWIQEDLPLFSQLDTTCFVNEILDGHAPMETKLSENIFLRGQTIKRALGQSSSVTIQHKSDIFAYSDFVKRLADDISKRGLVPSHDFRKMQNKSKNKNTANILCAIDKNGIYFTKNGNHRLSIALYLGLECIPVELHSISLDLFSHKKPV